MPKRERVLSPPKDYRRLTAYRKAEIVYDLTNVFCRRFLDVRDRTNDQMIQAARSGKQNIVEGTKAARTSKISELKLLNVARASFEELLEDYRDHLRTTKSATWDKDSREAQFVRGLHRGRVESFELYRDFVETRPAGVVANIALCLINQTNFLLDRLIVRLEQDYLDSGGLREQLLRIRAEARERTVRRRKR